EVHTEAFLTSSSQPETMRIEYSVDGDATWTPIDTYSSRTSDPNRDFWRPAGQRLRLNTPCGAGSHRGVASELASSVCRTAVSRASEKHDTASSRSRTAMS